MNAESERELRKWLEARDPGDAPDSLRASAAEVPYATRPGRLSALDGALGRLFGPFAIVRPVLLLIVLLALLLAGIGAALVLRSQPFPPPGLIAYTVRVGQTASIGIRLVAADGTGDRLLTAVEPNSLAYSPRWSPDGRSMVFGRVSNLDAFTPCLGVSSIVVYDLATSTERVVATSPRPVQVVEWSPTGDAVAFVTSPPSCSDRGELGVVDMASGRITRAPHDAGTWNLQWVGGVASVAPIDLVRGIELPSGDDKYKAGCPVLPSDADRHLVITDQAAGAELDLGPGVGAAWSPDDTSIAFIQPIGPTKGQTVVHARLAVANVDKWKVRVFHEALIEITAGQVAAHTLHWTADGRAIYWTDLRGGHVLSLGTGVSADLPGVIDGSTDVQWQPVP